MEVRRLFGSRHPHWLYALAGVLCFLAGLATSLIEPTPTLAVGEVEVLKPIDGDAAPAIRRMPIETLYGVPSERTAHLWNPGR